MLDDFKSRDDVEAFAALGEGLRRHVAIVDVEPGLRRMAARDLDVVGGGIDSRHLRAELGQRLRQYPPPQPMSATVRPERCPSRSRPRWRAA